MSPFFWFVSTGLQFFTEMSIIEIISGDFFDSLTPPMIHDEDYKP